MDKIKKKKVVAWCQSHAQGAAKLPSGDTGHSEGPAGPPSLEASAPQAEGRDQRPL